MRRRASTRVPASMSSPRRLTWRPGGVASTTRTRSPWTLQISTGTTVSADGGSGAPVAISTASPGPTMPPNRRPGRDWPMARKTAGVYSSAPKVSSPRSAKPSIAARSKGGTGSSARISAASTRAAASPMLNSSGARVSIRQSIHASTSSTGDRARKPRRRGSGNEHPSGIDPSVMAGRRGSLPNHRTVQDSF